MHSFKLVAETKGAHVHVRVFSGRDGQHRGLAGTLVFRHAEWTPFRDAFKAGLPGNEYPEVLEVEES